MSELLGSSGEWLAAALPMIGIVAGILLFSWAFIFLTVRAAVKSALRDHSLRPALRNFSTEGRKRETKHDRWRRETNAPTPIKAAPGPRDWERKLSDY